ncbi:MAG TPA: tetratricopeptide repeat protein, partial [Isosphaeraceae bacterium]|nr:tetratricopeptide repeat protein [Isosphaeraceae bacterium]
LVVDDEKRQASPGGGERKIQRVYRVQKVDGPWLWLAAESRGSSGWVQAEQVVPIDQAIDYYTNEIRANLDSSTYATRGSIWLDKHEYDIAVGDFNEAIRLDLRNEAAFVGRGNAWRAKKELDKALADYNEAIRLDPNYALAYHNRGLAWSDKGELDKALADYGAAIRLDPNDASAYYNRGNAWSDKGELDKALADFDEAIRLDPNYAWAYYNRGLARADKGELGKALADYGAAIRLDPNDAAAYNSRAWLWATCSDAKYRDGRKALADASLAYQLGGERDPNILDTLAAACAASGDFDAAMKWQEKAMDLLAKGDEKSRKDYGSRLDLYRAKKPFRQEPAAR